MTEPGNKNGGNGAPQADAAAEESRARELAGRYRCPFVDLKEQPIDHELLRSIPVDLMFRYHFVPLDRKSTRLNSSHSRASRMPSSA